MPSLRRGLGWDIVRTARRTVALGLTHGTSGNVSARVPGGLRITPTRRRFDELRPRHLVTTDLLCRHDASGGLPSIELPLHALVYRLRPEVNAVVHTHSPYATAWSCAADHRIEADLEEREYYGLPHVAVAPYAPSGTPELALSVTEQLGSAAAVLLERHGVVAVARSLDEALAVAEFVEHQAKVAWLAAALTDSSLGAMPDA